jgi:pimeloyl-ACP methyl ester carboxylesterase
MEPARRGVPAARIGDCLPPAPRASPRRASLPLPDQVAIAQASLVVIDSSPNSVGAGTWSAGDDGSVEVTFLSPAVDPEGAFLGFLTIRASLEVSDDGDGFSGTYTLEFPSAVAAELRIQEGELGPSDVTAERIALEPMGEPVGPAPQFGPPSPDAEASPHADASPDPDASPLPGGSPEPTALPMPGGSPEASPGASPATSQDAPLPAAAQEDTFDSAGVPIHFLDMGGDGEPVVLIHSFLSSSEMWTNAGFEPSDEFRFIALDLRGHGGSGKPEDPEAYGTEMVEDVVRLLDHLGIDQAHLVGYSIGAEIALKLATEHPQRVRSLVAAGSGWSDPAKAADVYSQVAIGLANSPTIRDLILAGMPPDIPPEQLDFVFGAMEQHGIDLDYDGTAGLAGVAASMGQILGLTEAEVAAIDVPLLGIVSENDSERPALERLEGVVPDFRLVLIPAGPTGDPSLDHLGATHDPMFRDSIMEFLSEQT